MSLDEMRGAGEHVTEMEKPSFEGARKDGNKAVR
ncbi:MAG: hypothetical protein UW32_C0001G0019 [Candidatus Wolfebacteria bacterium GW2011_GWE2_44_13]|uniref:Uncharacterized protein n=1 Tax=Candidatus Wolfebacteria bacterium GW2011_GWE2_44_13 TaxID=1619017 RepID=A0A0G1JHE1_9BACT|nr:MAG: hypothetical protein UW32_C0001G0019 [Candidatus Wolfebacteria bacterium GW2011_GWE2_44_13]